MEFTDAKNENPFPGLRPFETNEYHLFFGREGQSDELLERLQRTRFLAVVGTSGSGKSSLIRAGLLPALYGGLMAKAGSAWRVALFRPGSDPIGNLARELGKEAAIGASGQNAEVQTTIIETTLRRSTLGLVDAVRQARLDAHENLLVVADQFEELFRFKETARESGTEDDAAAFVKLLLEAPAQRDVPIYVVLTMRSDFLGDCAQFWGLPEAINTGQYLIPRMTRDERHAAITGPVAVGGGEITVPLVNRLLNDMGDNPDHLPTLQHALMRTWDYWTAHRRNGEPVGLPHYEAIGGMSEALSLHADEAFNELNERQQLIAERMFKALTEKGADNREIRRPTSLREICEIAGATEAEVIAVIDVFRHEGRSFLVPPAGTELDAGSVTDISHESLIRNWDRLQKWVSEEAQSARTYRRLAEAAVLHREGKEGLLNDPALQIALDWREQSNPNAAWGQRYHPEFETAIAYLEKSRTHRDTQIEVERERERRELEQARTFAAEQAKSARRFRRLTWALAALLLLSVGTAVFAFAQRAQAQANEERAIESERVAHVEKLKADAFAANYYETAEKEKVAKEEAERQRAEAEKSKNEAQAAQLDAQKKASIAEQERSKAEGEKKRADEQAAIAKRNAEAARLAEREANRRAQALEANALFRNAAVLSQRGEFSKAAKMLREVIKSMEDKAVNDLEGVADTYVQLGNLHFGLNGDFKEAVENFNRAASLYLRVNAPDKAANAHAATGAQLSRFADERDKYVKYEATHQDFKALLGDCRRRERVNNLSYQPTRLCSIPSVVWWSPDEVREAAREQYLSAYTGYERAGDREGMADMAIKIAEAYLENPGDDYEGAGDMAAHYYEKLLTFFPNDADSARVLVRLARIRHELGAEGPVVRGYTDRILDLYRDSLPDARALTELGEVLLDTNQTKRAFEFYETALAGYRRASDPALEARTLYQIGVAHGRVPMVWPKVTAVFAQAVERYRRDAGSGDRQDLPGEFFEPLFDIGSFAENTENGALAQSAYETALAYGKREENTGLQARAYVALGFLNQSLARYEAARTYYEQALTGYQRMRALAVESNDKTRLPTLDAQEGEVKRAIALIDAEAARRSSAAPTS